jgi:hypothetical protein
MPNPTDFGELLEQQNQRRHEILNKLLEVCRHLEPQLRDLNAHHSADRIAALISEYDAVMAEVKSVFEGDPEKAIKALIEMIEKRK